MGQPIEASASTPVVREIITVAPLADANPDTTLRRVKVDYTCGFLPGYGVHKVISEGCITSKLKQDVQAARDLAMRKCYEMLWDKTPGDPGQRNSIILFTPEGLHVEVRDYVHIGAGAASLVSFIESFTNAHGGLVANFRAFSCDAGASHPSFVLSPEAPHNERRVAELIPELAGAEEKDTTVLRHYEQTIRDVIRTQRELMGHVLSGLLGFDALELIMLLEHSAFAITHNDVKFWFYVNIENVLHGTKSIRPS